MPSPGSGRRPMSNKKSGSKVADHLAKEGEVLDKKSKIFGMDEDGGILDSKAHLNHGRFCKIIFSLNFTFVIIHFIFVKLFFFSLNFIKYLQLILFKFK